MMFRWTNKQPGIQQFWNLCSHYQDICDWISPLNKQSGLPFILIQQSMGKISTKNQVPFFLKVKTLLINAFNKFFEPHRLLWYRASQMMIAVLRKKVETMPIQVKSGTRILIKSYILNFQWMLTSIFINMMAIDEVHFGFTHCIARNHVTTV